MLWAIRKSMSDQIDFAERFLKKMRMTKSNEEFFEMLKEEWKTTGIKSF
jgi:transcription termination factor Rho